MSSPLDRVTDAELALHEALRRSHCDHRCNDDPTHKCVGVTIITAAGVKLSCTLCGTAALQDRIGNAIHPGSPGSSVRSETKRHLRVLNFSMSRALFNLMNATEELEYEEP